jgi:SAM-dependent methyltransferase
MNQYNDSFYNSQIKESKNSAIKIVPIVQNLVNPKSIVDVGCGVGAWLNIWKELHPELKVKGIDTNYFSIDKLLFNVTDFVEADLSKQIPSIGKFDLAISLEVAEHLPPERAKTFIQELCTLSDTILFSAAVPGQEGTQHLNEQYLTYWVELFKNENYLCHDIIRPKIWSDDEIMFWYKQNIVIFTKKSSEFNSKFEKEKSFNGENLIHWQLLEYKEKKANRAISELSSTLKNPLNYARRIVNGIVKRLK